MTHRAVGALIGLAVTMAGCSYAPEPPVMPGVATSSPLVLATSAPPPTEPADIAPVEGTNLPLAGRGGAPGLITCGRVGPTTIEALTAGPVGAELRAGPEYDVLRATIAMYGDDPEFADLRRATFREFRLDAATVEFLGDIGSAEGTFPTVTAKFDGGRWAWAGMDGGCLVTGEPGAGWGAVNWTVDPTGADPTEDTRDLQLLATEAECSPTTPLEGRLAPAYVFLEPDRVRVQLFARTVEIGAPCDGIEPTTVTLRLPEPLGRRVLEDANPEPCRGCGG